MSIRNCLMIAVLAPFLNAQVLIAPTAIEQLNNLRQQAHAAIASGDQGKRLAIALQLQKLVHGSPAGAETVAQAYAAAGNDEGAIAALQQFAEMGQADDDLLSGKDKGFSRLHSLPVYQQVLKKFAENKLPVSRAETAFELSDAKLLTEDIDYDPRTKSFLLSSVLEGKIIRVSANGKAVDFARSPSGWPILALKVDGAHKRLWATEVALDGFQPVPAVDRGRSALLCFDLNSGILLQRIEGPRPSSLGDMVLTPQGVPIVSDGDGGGIYRLQENKLVRIDRGDFISPQTPALHPDRRHIFIPDYTRGIGVLDLTTGEVQWLGSASSKLFALSGVDGLYFDQAWLILTQNGTSPERVLRMKLDSTLTHIVSEEIIERSTPTLGDPTHGVVVGNSFYYIANSGWNQIDEHGVLLAGGAFTPARVMRFRLR